MSQLLINDYLKQLDRIRRVSGSNRETMVREAFKDLLKSWSKQHGLDFLAEYPLKTAAKTNITVDGALLHELRMPLGYWEAKDADDDLDQEVVKKFRKGYPQDNIIFSDDAVAVLWQNRTEVTRCDMTDTLALARLLKLFFSFERPEIAGFRAAVEQFDSTALSVKANFLIDTYNDDLSKLADVRGSSKLADMLDPSIKWTRAVKGDLRRGLRYEYDESHIVDAIYRPFTKAKLYFDKHLNEMQYQLPTMFRGEVNPTITFLCVSSSNPLAAMALDRVFDYCLLKMGNGGTQAVSRWAYDAVGNRVDNITDWALKQFAAHYNDKALASTGSARAAAGTTKAKKVIKEAIFHYCYAVLHDPIYREKYAQNLKREFPRIPLYGTTLNDFRQWAAWGDALMQLHIGYENVAPFPLARTDIPDAKARAAGLSPKALLRSDPASGTITLDSETTLRGIPPEAWTYKLGNRCALDWVLDQYKEKKPKDPTIREKFDTYRFADYKEKVIDLLTRVTTVSVETVKIVDAMKKAAR